MAEEALRGKYGAQSEVLSCGLVLLELTSGCLITDDTRDEVDEATKWWGKLQWAFEVAPTLPAVTHLLSSPRPIVCLLRVSRSPTP